MSATWNNTGVIAPPVRTTVFVKDSINGPTYTARWNGPGYGWQVVSYPKSAGVSVGQPMFWLNYD